MDLPDLPWLALLGAFVPVVGLVWKVLADRGAKMAGEIAQIEQAIASANSRNDPIQHAYRAVAFERLNRAHQKDRSSSGFAFLLLWGLYAILIWGILLFTRPEPGSNDAILLTTGAAASSFLALRGWAKWMAGNVTLEPQANAAYRVALTDARRTFVKHANELPDLETPPKLFQLLRDKLGALPAGRRHELAALAWFFILAIPVAALVRYSWMSGWFEYRLAAQVALAIFLGTWLWLLRKLHFRAKSLLPFRVAKKYEPVVVGVSALAAAVLVAFFWWKFSAWMTVQALRESAIAAEVWGWSFVLAILLTIAAYMVYLDSRPAKRPPVAND